MGYMTVVTISNDGWEIIKRNQVEFIENIEAGMNGLNSINGRYSLDYVNEYSVGNFHCPMKVSKSFHADSPNVFWVGRNGMVQLTDANADTEKAIKEQLNKITESKKLINIYEKLLKEKLKQIKEKSKEE